MGATINYLIMDINLFQLASECPGLTISASAADLVKMGNEIANRILAGIQDTPTPANTPELLTCKQVAEKLSVDPSTLWRWDKKGYLKSIIVGGLRRYRTQDINEILEGKR